MVFAWLLLGLACGRGKGEIVLSDDFAYADGVLEAVSAGKWVGHSGAASETAVAGGALSLSQSNSQDVNSALINGPYNETLAPALYAKFKVRFSQLPSATGGYFAHFNATATGFRARIWALVNGAAPGAFRLGISSGSGSTPTAVYEADLQLETEYTVVIRLSLSDSVSTLWIDPLSENDPSVTSDTATATPISSYAFRQASGIGLLTVDDLIVATTFEQAVPDATQNQGPPNIISQPESQTAPEGSTTILSVKANGAPPLAYQWQFNGSDLPGETSPTLTLPRVTSSHAGDYVVIVSNAEGTAISDPATLAIGPPVTSGGRPPIVTFTNLLENLIRPGDAARSTNLTEYALRPNETLTIHTAIQDPVGRVVDVRLVDEKLPDRIHWNIPQASGFEVTPMLIFTAAAEDAGNAFVAQLEASNGEATNRVSWKIYVPTLIEQQMVISEFLANPTTNTVAPHYNPLRRATPSSRTRIGLEDEYVEIVNLSDAVVDLHNWTLSDGVAIRHAFGVFDLLRSSNAVVVYGGRTSGSEPELSRGVLAFSANRGTAGLALNNGSDSIRLRNAQGHLVSRIFYTSSLANRDGSVTRAPDLNGAFAKHASVSAQPTSPGTQNDGQPFGDPDAGPLPLKVAANFGAGFSILVRWTIETNRTYSVLRSANVSGPFETVATGLAFSGRLGDHVDNDASTVPLRFYRIRSP